MFTHWTCASLINYNEFARGLELKDSTINNKQCDRFHSFILNYPSLIQVKTIISQFCNQTTDVIWPKYKMYSSVVVTRKTVFPIRSFNIYISNEAYACWTAILQLWGLRLLDGYTSVMSPWPAGGLYFSNEAYRPAGRLHFSDEPLACWTAILQ